MPWSRYQRLGRLVLVFGPSRWRLGSRSVSDSDRFARVNGEGVKWDECGMSSMV